jgi:hypothetical protein
MDTETFLTVMSATLAANALTIFFLRGMWEISQREKHAKAEGREADIPIYLYLSTAAPPLIMAGVAYYLS